MTVEENLRLGAGLKHQQEFEQSRDYAFELFPVLARLRDTHAGLLSGGEQQQLAVGPGADEQAEAAPARRAVARPRAGDRLA